MCFVDAGASPGALGSVDDPVGGSGGEPQFEPPPVASAVPVAVAEVLAPVVVPRGLCTRSRLHLRAVQMYTTWKKKALAPAAEHLGKAPRHAGKAR